MGHNATDVALLLSIFNQKEETHYDKYMLSNASLTVIEIKEGKPEIKLLNYTAHLQSRNSIPNKNKSKK